MNETVELPTTIEEKNFDIPDMGVQITLKALKQLKEALDYENKNNGFQNNDCIRIGVMGRPGCSGFKFKLEVIDEKEIDEEEDISIFVARYGFFLCMDVFSKQYMNGTVIDYVESLMETGFKFRNDAIKKSCGCRSVIFGLRYIQNKGIL